MRVILIGILLLTSVFFVACEKQSAATPASGETTTSDRLNILADGKALAGAMITMTADGRRTTVFSHTDGTVELPATTESPTELLIRYPGMEPVTLAGDELSGAVNLHAANDPLAALPSSYWLSLLPDGEMRQEFILNCGTCHGIAQSRIYTSGVIRNEALWFAGIAMMRAMDAYSVIPPDFDDAEYSAWLAEHMSEADLERLQQPEPLAAELADNIVITEYELPTPGSLPHDLVVGPDGLIWVTAFFNDQIWALDPESAAYRKFDIDDDPEVIAQARALKFADDGRLWVVNGGTSSVIRLDTDSGEWENFDVQMYAHSLDLDTAGNVWVNDYFAAEERIAKVDAASGEVSIISVPPANRPASEGIPLPYGLQVDSMDRLYSTQLAANTLVVYDTISGDAKLHEMPVANSGPRRPGLAPDGSLWIPEFNTGFITRFDPETETFERVNLGLATIGAYDIEVDQNSGVVWITGSLDSSLFRYDPKTTRIDRIPLPTEPAYTRHIAIDPESGDVWSAYSSLPAAMPRVVRIQINDDVATASAAGAVNAAE